MCFRTHHKSMQVALYKKKTKVETVLCLFVEIWLQYLGDPKFKYTIHICLYLSCGIKFYQFAAAMDPVALCILTHTVAGLNEYDHSFPNLNGEPSASQQYIMEKMYRSVSTEKVDNGQAPKEKRGKNSGNCKLKLIQKYLVKDSCISV
ncbi:hypothetical protein BT96DRAFT_158686 [Gymnopus androsaceus JB14]|uniref:Uncharacterized protein n=1 Tax=Gymnopus androsaceus JB14 TaxID=1447944 RepID=A0A6A4HBP4_9AGAR|nr:hypothetical protein BT96DRAFT_158686 [Gymnopus androsaceus JB14]